MELQLGAFLQPEGAMCLSSLGPLVLKLCAIASRNVCVYVTLLSMFLANIEG